MSTSTQNGMGLKSPNSPYTEEECEEIITKLEEMLDGALEPEVEQKVMALVDKCQFCLEQYRIEKVLRNMIKSGYQNFLVSQQLVSRIRSRISG